MQTKKKILIVDDDVFFRKVLKDALADHYQIIEGENAAQAIALATEQRPQLILLDVIMPDGSGIEACRELKCAAATRKIPVILFTSLAQKKDIVLGLKAGADDYMTKPMYLPEVIARVKAHLRSKDDYADLLPQDLRLLLELSQDISAIRNPMTILRLIVEKMSAIIDVSRCSIVSIDSNGEMLVKASSDLEENREIRLDLDKYPEIRKSLESKEAVIVNNMAEDPLMDSVRPFIKGLEFNSIIVIPVIKKECIIGTFFLRTGSPIKDGITRRISKVCQLVANISANALENAMLFDSMKTAQEYFEDMSIRDGLTKLYNHRHFYSRLEEEFSRAARYRLPLSLIFCDIDDFKRINDVYGHARGDEVLKQFGQLIKSVARETDLSARYGGEEFAIILPNTTAEGALDLAHRLQTRIRKQVFDQLPAGQVTISVGIATSVDKNILGFDQLVHLADEAMYRAKTGGKDRIIQV